MNRFLIFLILYALTFLFFINSALGTETPNIVLIYADDMGWADLGANGVDDDVQTPNLDALAASGVRFTNSYVTAPQCTPSRAGLLTGVYPEKFGVEKNTQGPLPLDQVTIAERIRDQGYATGMAGKWHLTPSSSTKEWIDENLAGSWSIATERRIAPYRSYNRGFTDAFEGNKTSIRATYDLEGQTLTKPTVLHYPEEYRLDLQTQAGLTFIDRHKEEPFFLYLSYFAPHEPLEAPQEYLDRFSEDLPERRRYALAMNAAVDDGVGQIMQALEENDLTENTLVMFISDNGADLDLNTPDAPIDQLGWNGSLNTPFLGQKATLMEGGIRVPFVASMPGTIPEGIVNDDLVMQLDASATAVALAGGDVSSMDGKNLLPHLRGEAEDKPHDILYWQFGAQQAVREDNWKLLRLGHNQTWLFDLSDPNPEKVNLASQHPDLVARLSKILDGWSESLPRSHASTASAAEYIAFNHFLQTPQTGISPDVVVDLGYDQIENAKQIGVFSLDYSNVEFGGIRSGAGISEDTREGTARSNFESGGGAISYVGWDLPTGSSREQSILTDHYIEFDLTLDGQETLAIQGIQISGIAGSSLVNSFSLFASSDGFSELPSPNDRLASAVFKNGIGDFDDSENPVRNYRPLDFMFDSPLTVDADESSWTFRLYLNENPKDDLVPFIVDSIAFDLIKFSQGDFTRDGIIDDSDLVAWANNFGLPDSVGVDGDKDTDGGDYLALLRNFGSGIPPNPDVNNDGYVNHWDLQILTSSLGISNAGDTNRDNVTDGADLLMFYRNFQQTVSADFNQDGEIDHQDLRILQNAFGNTTSGDADQNEISNGADFLQWYRSFASTTYSDFDGDRQITYLDLAILQAAFGNSAEGDSDGNGITNGADFLTWYREFETTPNASLATIPEPECLGIVFLAIMISMSTYRRIILF